MSEKSPETASTSAAEESTSSPGALPASPSPRRVRGSGVRTRGGCGANCSESCVKCDPIGSLLRTSLASVLGAQTQSSPRWLRQITPGGRSWWGLIPQDFSTAEGVSSWSSAVARYRGALVVLITRGDRWSTPLRGDSNQSISSTPIRSLRKLAKKASAEMLSDQAAVLMYRLRVMFKPGDRSPEASRSVFPGWLVNPTFLGELMGFPRGWHAPLTREQPRTTETPSRRRSRKRSGELSS